MLQVHVGTMRSTSVGWLKLKSTDPNDHPIIEPNYMSTGKAASPCADVNLFPALFQTLISTQQQFRSAGWCVVIYFLFIKVRIKIAHCAKHFPPCWGSSQGS